MTQNADPVVQLLEKISGQLSEIAEKLDHAVLYGSRLEDINTELQTIELHTRETRDLLADDSDEAPEG